MTKRYEIEHISDILNIPEESFDDFLVDLREFYALGRSAKAMVEGLAGLVGKENISMDKPKFTWIDDGKHDKQVKITIIPKED